MSTYSIREEGFEFDIIDADSAKEALDQVDVSNGDYDTSDGTVWITIYAVNQDDENDDDCRTFTIDPRSPSCNDPNGHDWQTPYSILGGLKENPGVWGHGGGVVMKDVCMRCGCGKTTDTWAQNPENGEQGLTSVRYELGKYSDTISETSNEDDRADYDVYA